jgi:ankyrin repeat protein
MRGVILLTIHWFAASHRRHFDVAKLLLQHGAAVDVPGFDNRSLMLAASADGLVDIAGWFLGHGADAYLQNNNHWTSIMMHA